MTDQLSLLAGRLLNLQATPLQRLEATAEAIEEYQILTLASSWDRLVDHSSRLGGLAETTLHLLATRASLSDPARRDLAAYDKAFKVLFETIRDDTSAKAEEMRQGLLEALEEDMGDPADAESRLTELLDGEGPLFEQAKLFNRQFNIDEELLIDIFTKLRMFMLEAEFAGLYHQSLAQARTYNDALAARLDGFPGVALGDEDIELLQEHADSFSRLVDDGFTEIYTSLSSGVPVEDFERIVDRLYSRTARSAGIAGTLLGAFVAMANLNSDPVLRTSQLQIALGVSENRARAFLLHAYVANARANIQSRDVNRWFSNEKQRTEVRQLSSGVETGVQASVDDLVQDMALNEGDLVSVEGVVQNLRVVDDPSPPKFSSFFDLTSESDASVVVRAHMFSLENNGLRDGAYCRLQGFLRRGEAWLTSGDVGLDIDRVSLSTLRSDHWLDDVTYRMRPYYKLFFDEMNMFFTPT